MEAITVVAALLVVVGIVGIVVPILPGLVLTWAGVALWALATRGVVGWSVFFAATLVVVLGSVVKYLLPGKKLRESGVPWSTIAAGGVLGVVGFFVVPVLGLVLGFLAGIYLAEMVRLGGHEQAWPSTKRALVLTGWSILIELATGLLTAAIWVGGMLAAA